MYKKLIKTFNLFHFGIFIIVLVLGINSCDSPITDSKETNLGKINEKVSKANVQNSNIQKFARVFAKYLSDIEAQKFLERKIKNSEYVENIIETTELLSSEIDKKLGSKILKSKFKKELLESSEKNEKDEIARWFNELKFGDIDIYFPVKKHRESWKAGDDLLVVGFIPTDKNSKEPVTAYDIKGNEIVLSQDTAPETPTLVIYPSEKSKNYFKNNKSENSNISFADFEREPEPPSGDNW